MCCPIYPLNIIMRDINNWSGGLHPHSRPKVHTSHLFLSTWCGFWDFPALSGELTLTAAGAVSDPALTCRLANSSGPAHSGGKRDWQCLWCIRICDSIPINKTKQRLLLNSSDGEWRTLKLCDSSDVCSLILSIPFINVRMFFPELCETLMWNSCVIASGNLRQKKKSRQRMRRFTNKDDNTTGCKVIVSSEGGKKNLQYSENAFYASFLECHVCDTLCTPGCFLTERQAP